LATVVLTHLTASLTAILIATIPLVITLLAGATGRRVSHTSAASLLVGFIGVTIVVITAPAAALGGSAMGLVLCAVAVMCWAAGSLAGSRGGLPGDLRVSAGVQLLVGGSVLLAIAAITGQLTGAAWTDVSPSSLLAAAFLLAFDSIAGFLLYVRLLSTTPLELVSTYAYATPILSAILGFAALGEPVWTGALVGGAVVVIAVVAQVRATSQSKAKQSG